MTSRGHRLVLAVATFCLVFTFMPVPQADAQRVNVLIVGDSVASVLRWAPESMRPLWGGAYNTTLEVWGCQKLLDPGCIDSAQKSALDQIMKYRTRDIDIVVMATGYNDTGSEYVRRAIRKINAEVRSQGASLMWLTYRENGNVKIKNRAFNKVLRREAKSLQITLLDWEFIARKNKHWFSGDRVHMNRFGGLQLARNIKKALDLKMGYTRATTTTSTTTTTPTTTTVVATTVPS
jgi:hypothetical protein